MFMIEIQRYRHPHRRKSVIHMYRRVDIFFVEIRTNLRTRPKTTANTIRIHLDSL